MERIHYAAGTFRTGTDIARAALDFSEALARRGTSATVDIPIRNEDGVEARANFLLGPSSELVSESYEDEFGELTDEALVQELRARIKRLEGSPVQPLTPEAAARIDLKLTDDWTIPNV